MDKIDDLQDILIPEAKYVPELEEKVKYYISITPQLPARDTVFQKTVMPEFETIFEQKRWEKEEIRRCKEGHDDICGKMYFYVNYCHILDVERGMITPDFRVADSDWFHRVFSGSQPSCLAAK